MIVNLVPFSTEGIPFSLNYKIEEIQLNLQFN